MNELINQWTSINGKMNIEVMIHTHANTNWNIFSDIKKNEILPFVTTWMDLEGLGTRVHLWRIQVDVWQNQFNIVK